MAASATWGPKELGYSWPTMMKPTSRGNIHSVWNCSRHSPLTRVLDAPLWSAALAGSICALARRAPKHLMFEPVGPNAQMRKLGKRMSLRKLEHASRATERFERTYGLPAKRLDGC
jgi:hypothetical protein